MRILYPRSKANKPQKKRHPQEDLSKRAFHVEYSDPDNPDVEPEWRHYNTELEVKVGAWYNIKFLGFNKRAVMYTREELEAQKQGKK
jgi:hypothetical protein